MKTEPVTQKTYADLPWSTDGIRALLRYGMRNEGPWYDIDDIQNQKASMPDTFDAELIACAQEMLAALKEFAAWAKHVEPKSQRLKNARKLIKKAEKRWAYE